MGVVVVAAVLLVYAEVQSVSDQVRAVAQTNEQLGERVEDLREAIPQPPPRGPARGPMGGPAPGGGPPPGGGEAPGDDWAACTGQVPRAVVDRVLDETEGDFQECYGRRLGEEPDLAGEVNIEVKVNSEGEMIEARVSGDFQDEALFQCLLDLATRLDFGEVEGGDCAVVRLPFRFAPNG